MEKKKRKFTRLDSSWTNGNVSPTCPICLDEFRDHIHSVNKFKCNHCICSTCFAKHLGSRCSAVCPICRKSIDDNSLNEEEKELYNNRPSYLEDNDIDPFELLSNLIDDDSNDSNSDGIIWYGASTKDVSRLSRAFGFTSHININNLCDEISKILPSDNKLVK